MGKAWLAAALIAICAGTALGVTPEHQACGDSAATPDAQVKACTAALEIDPANIDALYARGLVYLQTEVFDAAIADLTKVVEFDSARAGAYQARGAALRRKGDPNAAIADETRAIALDSNLQAAYAVRGTVHREQGDLARARSDLDHALKLNPGDASALEQRNILGLQTADVRMAVGDADALAKLAPEDARYQNLKCWTRVVWRYQLDVARTACDTAITLSGGKPGHLGSRGLLNLKQGRYQDAFDDYDAAVKGDAADASLLFGRGLAAGRLGMKGQAQADMEAARALDPNIADLFRQYGYRV